jgi:hypothetical protein
MKDFFSKSLWHMDSLLAKLPEAELVSDIEVWNVILHALLCALMDVV